MDRVENTKRALASIGLYKPPELFVARFSNEPLRQGLKTFQQQQGLVPDGVMKPDGPTHQRLNEMLGEQQLASRFTNSDGRTTRKSGHQFPSAIQDIQDFTSNDDGDEEQVATVHIPIIVYEIAQLLSISVAAAWAWWQSKSDAEKERIRQQISRMDPGDSNGRGENAEVDCEHLYDNVDIPICRALRRRRGKAAAAKCYATAEDRYEACGRGIPLDRLPPLNVWNN